MKQAKELRQAPQQVLWSAERSKGRPTRQPSNRRHRPPHNNSSRRKHRQRLSINRGLTRSNAHSLPAWSLGATPLSDDLGPSPDSGQVLVQSYAARASVAFGLTSVRAYAPGHHNVVRITPAEQRGHNNRLPKADCVSYSSKSKFVGLSGVFEFLGAVRATSGPTTSKLAPFNQTSPGPVRSIPSAMPVASFGTSRTTS